MRRRAWILVARAPARRTAGPRRGVAALRRLAQPVAARGRAAGGGAADFPADRRCHAAGSDSEKRRALGFELVLLRPVRFWLRRRSWREAKLTTLALSLVALALSCGDATDALRQRQGTAKTGAKINRYSQVGEEVLIREFFDDRRGGVYVDVGAAWARRNSTTYYLERHLGWTGIGVDALDVYRKSWERFRPNSRFFQYAVTDHSGDTVTFFRASEPTVSSLFREKLQEWWGPDLETREVKVDTITLTDLLDRNHITEIDFLSVDIEGAEPLALAGFDIDRFRPELVCIEVASEQTEAQIPAYFEAHGYGRIDEYVARDKVNWYFRRKARR